MGFSERFSFGVQKKAILENQYERFCVFRHNILIFISLELSFCIQQLVKLPIDGDPIVINTFFGQAPLDYSVLEPKRLIGL